MSKGSSELMADLKSKILHPFYRRSSTSSSHSAASASGSGSNAATPGHAAATEASKDFPVTDSPPPATAPASDPTTNGFAGATLREGASAAITPPNASNVTGQSPKPKLAIDTAAEPRPEADVQSTFSPETGSVDGTSAVGKNSSPLNSRDKSAPGAESTDSTAAQPAGRPRAPTVTVQRATPEHKSPGNPIDRQLGQAADAIQGAQKQDQSSSVDNIRQASIRSHQTSNSPPSKAVLSAGITQAAGALAGALNYSPSSVHPIARGIVTPQLLNTNDLAVRIDPVAQPQSVVSMQRRIWVKRAGAAATLVQISDDQVVDDVKDAILRKYGNSLGRRFDSPDLTIYIHPRETSRPRSSSTSERVLGPEEPIARILDVYYPGGQSVHEALTIEIPSRRTPRLSPMVGPYAYHDDGRTAENGGGYFPTMPPPAISSPKIGVASSTGPTGPSAALSNPQLPHSIAILNSGNVAPLPSPRATALRGTSHRPKYTRHSTASPTAHAGTGSSDHRTSHGSGAGGNHVAPPPGPLILPPKGSTPPAAPAVSSPRLAKSKKSKKTTGVTPPTNALSLVDNAVPPINVLLVEDNIINLKLLEAFMKRLRVRWHTAINGRIAVDKWRQGGFHLVLMDIQLPIMNGLDATKEIRRLERVNGIGVLADKISDAQTETSIAGGESGPQGTDKLEQPDLFKGPVIIVALTASSLQSDRHEALAAGCNDFLTKPVNFVWLERKVKEWGCMQALIDFDGWRKWKDFASPAAVTTAAKPNVANAAPSTFGVGPGSGAPNRESSPIDRSATPRIREANAALSGPSTAQKQPAARPMPPAVLEDLHNKTTSDDTLDSVDTGTTSASTSSEDTAHRSGTSIRPHANSGASANFSGDPYSQSHETGSRGPVSAPRHNYGHTRSQSQQGSNIGGGFDAQSPAARHPSDRRHTGQFHSSSSSSTSGLGGAGRGGSLESSEEGSGSGSGPESIAARTSQGPMRHSQFSSNRSSGLSHSVSAHPTRSSAPATETSPRASSSYQRGAASSPTPASRPTSTTTSPRSPTNNGGFSSAFPTSRSGAAASSSSGTQYAVPPGGIVGADQRGGIIGSVSTGIVAADGRRQRGSLGQSALSGVVEEDDTGRDSEVSVGAG